MCIKSCTTHENSLQCTKVFMRMDGWAAINIFYACCSSRINKTDHSQTLTKFLKTYKSIEILATSTEIKLCIEVNRPLPGFIISERFNKDIWILCPKSEFDRGMDLQQQARTRTWLREVLASFFLQQQAQSVRNGRP